MAVLELLETQRAPKYLKWCKNHMDGIGTPLSIFSQSSSQLQERKLIVLFGSVFSLWCQANTDKGLSSVGAGVTRWNSVLKDVNRCHNTAEKAPLFLNLNNACAVTNVSKEVVSWFIVFFLFVFFLAGHINHSPLHFMMK